MSLNNSASFFYDEFRNLVENQDYQGLLTFFNDITNEQLAVLLRRQLDRLYDPILALCRMGQSENCLELILEHGFRVSRPRFLNLLMRQEYQYIELFCNYDAPIDKTALIIAGHNSAINILNMLFERWGGTGPEMDTISYNFLKNNKYEAFNWCLQNADFYVNVERCLTYATQNDLTNFMAILQEN